MFSGRNLLARTICGVLLAVSPVVPAATYVVNVVNSDLPDGNLGVAGCDTNPILAGDQCTLRAAVMQANASAAHDTIIVPLDATITLDLAGIGGASSGDLDITAPLTITGAPLGFPSDSARLPRIEAAFAERLFDITQPVAVTLRGLQLREGAPSGLAGTSGGALRITHADADVLVDGVQFGHNGAVTGGAVFNAGTLEVRRSNFSINQASATGGAIHVASTGNLLLRDSSLHNNGSALERTAIHAAQGAIVVIENSYMHGADFGEFPFGETAAVSGDRPALIALRNSTLSGFSGPAFRVNVDAATEFRLHNSVVNWAAGGICDFRIAGAMRPDIRISWSLLGPWSASDCNPWLGEGNLVGVDPWLAAESGLPGSFVRLRMPLAGSPTIDRAVPPDVIVGDPLESCAGVDQIGGARPVDGDGDGVARCDMGAIEALPAGR